MLHDLYRQSKECREEQQPKKKKKTQQVGIHDQVRKAKRFGFV